MSRATKQDRLRLAPARGSPANHESRSAMAGYPAVTGRPIALSLSATMLAIPSRTRKRLSAIGDLPWRQASRRPGDVPQFREHPGDGCPAGPGAGPVEDVLH